MRRFRLGFSGFRLLNPIVTRTFCKDRSQCVWTRSSDVYDSRTFLGRLTIAPSQSSKYGHGRVGRPAGSEDENRRLKKLLAETMLDVAALKDSRCSAMSHRVEQARCSFAGHVASSC
jgi:hypothetical protein